MHAILKNSALRGSLKAPFTVIPRLCSTLVARRASPPRPKQWMKTTINNTDKRPSVLKRRWKQIKHIFHNGRLSLSFLFLLSFPGNVTGRQLTPRSNDKLKRKVQWITGTLFSRSVREKNTLKYLTLKHNKAAQEQCRPALVQHCANYIWQHTRRIASVYYIVSTSSNVDRKMSLQYILD